MAIRKLWLSLPGAKKLEDNERGGKESHSESDRIMSMIKISNRIMLMEEKSKLGKVTHLCEVT